MNDREQRGLALAALYRIEQRGGVWIVPSQRGDGATCIVDSDKSHCTCRDHQDRAIKCKHMFAVEFVQTREKGDDGTETVTRSFKVTERVTCKQDWPNYNKAQTSEKRHFQSILADLCRGIPMPTKRGPGRPIVPPADVTFACVYKVYSTVSARRFSCDLEDAAAKGYMAKAPHYNVVIKHMDDPRLTPILKSLIIESSKPLAAVETDFAIDSSGFSTSRFTRWFDIKYGKTMEGAGVGQGPHRVRGENERRHGRGNPWQDGRGLAATGPAGTQDGRDVHHAGSVRRQGVLGGREP